MTIVSVYKSIVEIKKFLKGKKAQKITKDGDYVVIENPDGSILKIDSKAYNIQANNPQVNESIKKQFETLENDEQVSAVEIAAKDGTPILQVERNDFPALSAPTPTVDGETSERPQSAILSILKFSFDPKYKSDFYYQGNKISAYIRDKAFYENVDNGDSFSKGDALEVVMEVKRPMTLR
ncbi:hypothetical protein J2Y45_005474 [Dyadobacter sp. BE34]|uniref:Uncharacterized protein n=1 Tax=Dyadobacter fermentans TaxID=94254 RepID=A0ABU1R440_9BACT|nr:MULTISPECIES: hypothetical protein [Dyadobacter]MDR6808177.1 hypothetical protein [Dyadobacter fermentans]MDR7046007.1 hypothetical protein [Dyadobacter sp. BE242]MDR7200320.1 hypothetical protein [Dyadobacter sp. BE34]MDR7218280.1 hypothetical protein [Dyadobacter sp. BE31]MDR7266211.1 hypothetical protein [Dyadobacter sp. BE32]